MVNFVDGSLPWGRFETRLAGRIVKADPAAAAEREAAAQTEQMARRTRSSEHGIAGFYVRSTVGVIARLDATVAFLADALKAFGDPGPRGPAPGQGGRGARQPGPRRGAARRVRRAATDTGDGSAPAGRA